MCPASASASTNPARSRESGGAGLGLEIVKHIIERHRGLLAIASTVGIGTGLSARLPAA
jgi:two-component system phosphate regulon sensor histidine kinase PhoR